MELMDGCIKYNSTVQYVILASKVVVKMALEAEIRCLCLLVVIVDDVVV